MILGIRSQRSSKKQVKSKEKQIQRDKRLKKVMMKEVENNIQYGDVDLNRLRPVPFWQDPHTELLVFRVFGMLVLGIYQGFEPPPYSHIIVVWTYIL